MPVSATRPALQRPLASDHTLDCPSNKNDPGTLFASSLLLTSTLACLPIIPLLDIFSNSFLFLLIRSTHTACRRLLSRDSQPITSEPAPKPAVRLPPPRLTSSLAPVLQSPGHSPSSLALLSRWITSLISRPPAGSIAANVRNTNGPTRRPSKPIRFGLVCSGCEELSSSGKSHVSYPRPLPYCPPLRIRAITDTHQHVPEETYATPQWQEGIFERRQ